VSIKIQSVVGARPQFVKMAAFHRACMKKDIKHYILHTGQHYDANMSEVFFDELDIPKPDQNLGIGGGSHGENTGRMIEAIEAILLKEKPDWLVVFGDTDSTLAAAIAATKIHIPIAHIEAGLRSFNRTMPEEVNRVLTDHVSSLLFTGTLSANENLKNEGVPESCIHTCGDIMYDVAQYYKEKDNNTSILSELGLKPNQFVLATVHRAENTSTKEKMEAIVEIFSMIEAQVVLPLHPRTAKSMKDFQLSFPENLKIIQPIGYLDMLELESHAEMILTDSGGVQKEAYFHKKPCITLREETEWVELVHAGVNFIVGLDIDRVQAAVSQIKASELDFSQNLYGDGFSADRMVDRIIKESK